MAVGIALMLCAMVIATAAVCHAGGRSPAELFRDDNWRWEEFVVFFSSGGAFTFPFIVGGRRLEK
jgi:hypothetical protein